MSSVPQRYWRTNRPRGQVRRGGLIASFLLALTLGCDGSPSSPSTVPDTSSSGRETRTFSGTVNLPTPAEMKVTLVVDAARTARSSWWPTLVATLVAQETRRVTGTYTIESNPARRGRVEGTFEGASFLTAGMFRGMLIEEGPGCNPRQSYEGPVTAAGVRWTPTASPQRCAGRLLEFTPLELGAGDAPETDGDGDGDGDGDAPLATISLAGNGGGTVTSNPPGLDCSATGQAGCTSQFAVGVEVALTAVPAEGSVFAGWSGDGDCEDGRLTMDGPRRCTATFNTSDPGAPDRRLTVQVRGQGSGTVTTSPEGIDCPGTCTATFAEGTVVTLTPTPAAGSRFAGWSGGADCSDGSVTMRANRTCIATFAVQGTPPPGPDPDPELDQFTLSIERVGTGSGTVTSSPIGIDCGSICQADFDEGTVVNLVPSPDQGSTFAGWSGQADCNDGSVTMNAPRSCTATFDVIPPNTLAITLGGTGGGTVTSTPAGISCSQNGQPGCSNAFASGATVTLSATPDGNSVFTGWQDDADCTDGVVMMDAARGCTAEFDLLVTLTVTVSGTGNVSSDVGDIACPPACSDNYISGDVVTLTAMPGMGQIFTEWSGTSADCDDGVVTMSEATSCAATFVPNTLTIAVSGTGTVTADMGAISCPPTCSDDYGIGDVVTLTATPGTGQIFTGWSGTSADCDDGVVTMNGATSCTATFVPNELTVVVVGMGTVSSIQQPGILGCTAVGGPECSATFDDGDVVNLTAAPELGGTFVGWGPSCNSGNPLMDGPKSCEVTFNP